MAKHRRTCPHCEQTVGTRSVAGSRVVVQHNGPSGVLCPGTGLAVGAPDRAPAKPAAAKRSKNARSRAAAVRGGGGKASLPEIEVIRASERRERAEREAALRGDLGGVKSVRAVSGGLPTLGRGR